MAKRKQKKILSNASSTSYPITYSSLIRCLGITVAIIALLVIGKATFQKMAVNSRASVSDECQNEIAELGRMKREIAKWAKYEEEVPSDIQDEYNQAFNAYRDCRDRVNAMAAQQVARVTVTNAPERRCGNGRDCHSDERCLQTEHGKNNGNSGLECVPTRCLDSNYQINPSFSYCDPQQNLFNCETFMETGKLNSYSCSAGNMICEDDGKGNAACKANRTGASDCRRTDATHTTPNSNCSADTFCNLQTGRCVKSSTADGSTIDPEKTACTPTYTRTGCHGPDSSQNCTRHWDATRNLCVNLSCGLCQF